MASLYIYLIYICIFFRLSNTILRQNNMFQTYICFIELYKILIDVHTTILWERNKLGLIKDDSRGQLFSLDLLFALIPLVLVLGIVASDMDNIMYLVQDTVFQGSTDRVAADTLNTLLETSGQPSDWEQTNASSRIVGLAKLDSNGRPLEGTVSPSKLAALTETDIQNLVGDNYGFCLNVTTIDGSTVLRNISTGGLGYNSSASNVVRIERVALCSKLETPSYLKGQIIYTGQTRTYTAPSFNTSYYYGQTYNYWILMLNNTGFTSATVTINNNMINLNNLANPYPINSSFLNMNSSSPSQFYSNTVTVNATGSFGSSMDFYIVQAPKDVANSSINYNTVNPNPSRFIFYLWAK